VLANCRNHFSLLFEAGLIEVGRPELRANPENVFIRRAVKWKVRSKRNVESGFVKLNEGIDVQRKRPDATECEALDHSGTGGL
jgi:hypothetical protein